MKNRVASIKKKGFSIPTVEQRENDIIGGEFVPVDFSKVKVGAKTVEDAVYALGAYQRANPRLADKEEVLRAINTYDFERMREISNFFYHTSGMYQRLCRYIAYLYKYDWMVTPYFDSSGNVKPEKVKSEFNKILLFLDNFEIKKFLGEAALQVVRNGSYYGYIIRLKDRAMVQELPSQYCRSRLRGMNGEPIVEFNMAYFRTFGSAEAIKRVLDIFPLEFKKAYKLYVENKLPPLFPGDTAGWYLLDPNFAFKFHLNGEDFPAMISAIPAIIDLDEARGLDRKKMAQRLLKIIIQKMPIDKNGDLVFDVDEAAQLHNNAVRMLTKAIGIDVLTTFADVEVADMQGSGVADASNGEMERSKNAVFDDAGVPANLFNTDGNLALEKSVLNDEASIRNLIQQFESFLNKLISPFNKKNLYYRVQILETTIYNYKELAKMYKEQVQLGYSKMLPQIAMGQLQSTILANAIFENDVLDLVNVFIPPMSSNTMSADALVARNANKSGANEPKGEVGRPEKADDQKSEKTIANQESLS